MDCPKCGEPSEVIRGYDHEGPYLAMKCRRCKLVMIAERGAELPADEDATND
jgi:uncharacterized Zn finger protein